MRYFSTFSGIGGFELGIQQAYESLCNVNRSEDGRIQTNSERNEGQGLLATKGEDASTEERPVGECTSNVTHERPLCIGYSELDKYATVIYQKHFPEHKNYGDITTINAEELPDFDLLVGGFPCQAFSIAGRRRGFEDTRGTLFFDLARILKAKRPRLCLFENVKGLLSHDEGRTFATIIATLDELGYDCQWQVLNSKNHGVPQNRERVFIIGHLRGTPRPQVFPFGGNGRENNELQGHVSNTITARYEGAQATGTYIGEGELDAQKAEPSGQGVQQGGNKPDNSNLRRRQTHTTNIRRLTPTECERLQGFPDGWTEGVSDTQRYKTLGNAVTVNVIRDIAERLLYEKNT